MCQVHTGAYVSLLAPGKTDYTACHPRKTTRYILHVVPITTHTPDRRKPNGKKKQKRKKDKEKERKEKTRRARKDETRRASKERKEKKKCHTMIACKINFQRILCSHSWGLLYFFSRYDMIPRTIHW